MITQYIVQKSLPGTKKIISYTVLLAVQQTFYTRLFISNINLSCWSWPLLMYCHGKAVYLSHPEVLPFKINYFSSIFLPKQLQLHFHSTSSRDLTGAFSLLEDIQNWSHLLYIDMWIYIHTNANEHMHVYVKIYVCVFLFLYIHTQICHRCRYRYIKLLSCGDCSHIWIHCWMNGWPT